jgi:hypothetical protein
MGDATNVPADVLLTNVLLRLKVKGNKNNFFSLGPLRGHALLFPELFQTTSLGLLGSLFQKSRIGATAKSTLPGFQVHFGAGSFRERSLFLFFDTVLQFKDREHFLQVLDHGYSICVIRGPHNKIAAAIVFVSAAEGIFIDAIAVANGRGPSMCRLNSSSFIAGDAEQEKMIKNSGTGSFQHLGLGTLLLPLVEQIASQQCADKNPSIFLKTNPDGFEYYKKLQLVPLPAGTSLPPGLSLLVPERNYARPLVHRTVLVSRRVVRDKQPSPLASKVAAARGEPLSSDDSSSESDPELPAVNPSDPDGKPAAVGNDSDTGSQAFRRSPRGKRDKPAAVETDSDTGSQAFRRSPRGKRAESKDAASAELKSSKQNAKKRMKIEKARVLAMETCGYGNVRV